MKIRKGSFARGDTGTEKDTRERDQYLAGAMYSRGLSSLQLDCSRTKNEWRTGKSEPEVKSIDSSAEGTVLLIGHMYELYVQLIALWEKGKDGRKLKCD